MRLYDAHNHLQDGRLNRVREDAFAKAVESGVVKMIVNGTQERDWSEVLHLARTHGEIVPSVGLHPWYVAKRSAAWKQTLLTTLDTQHCVIGEIGLDRWINDFDAAQQEEVFVYQLQLAAERNLPVSIHCLQAWGALLEILRREPRPACGFLLHSYGGSSELIEPLAKLGAYFSCSGYFAHEKKAKQREVFRHVPLNRLLIETDAPDMLPPETLVAQGLIDEDGAPANHPANLQRIYRFVADLRGISVETLAGQMEENFKRLFG